MSRTTRRPNERNTTNRVAYINHDVQWFVFDRDGNRVDARWGAKRKLQTRDEMIAESEAEYAKLTRDGYRSSAAQNTGFKKQAATIVRRENARFCHKVVRGEDIDDVSYPVTKQGKSCIWDWWW